MKHPHDNIRVAHADVTNIRIEELKEHQSA